MLEKTAQTCIALICSGNAETDLLR